MPKKQAMVQVGGALRRMTARKKKKFLTAIAETGNITEACRLAQTTRTTVYRHKAADPDFAAKWEEAEEAAADMLEKEAWRRAVDGVEKGVYHEGKLVDVQKHYSDTLLIFLLKGRRPETYREKWQQSVNIAAPGDDVRIYLPENNRDRTDQD